jgi:hypothetical protein
MDDDPNTTIKEILFTLQQHSALLNSDPFFELGTENILVQSLAKDLNYELGRINELAPYFQIKRSVQAVNSYAAAIASLKKQIDFFHNLVAQKYGTAKNTTIALDLIDQSATTISKLLDFVPQQPILPHSEPGQSESVIDPPFASSPTVDRFYPTSESMTSPSLDSISRSDLLTLLIDKFTIKEIQLLCFKLNINHELLENDTILSLALSLIQYVERRDRYGELVEIVKDMRSHREIGPPAHGDRHGDGDPAA